MSATHKIKKVAVNALVQTQKRNATRYVISVTGKPYNTSHLHFKPVHPLIQESRYNEYVGSIITYLKEAQPFKITEDFKKYASRTLNKEYKDSKLLPGMGEYDLAQYIPTGSFQIDSDLIKTIHGETVVQKTEEFFKFKPQINAASMDMLLELNPQYFDEIKKKRVESILNWAVDVAEKNAKGK